MDAKVQKALRALARRGRLDPERVVEAARNPKSALHACFEWDDSAAAHAWRIAQARALIRSAEVTITVRERQITSVEYVRSPALPAREAGYIALSGIEPASDLAHDLLRQELQRVLGNLRRAQSMAQALGFEDRVVQALGGVYAILDDFETLTKGPTEEAPPVARARRKAA